MGRSEVSTSVVKWSKGLSNTVSAIIRRYIYIYIYIYEVCCLYGCFFYHIHLYSFGSILYHCIYGCMFCMLLFNFVYYVFLLLCVFRSGYSVSLCCSVCGLCVNVCKCVLYYCHRVSTQLQLTNISYTISSSVASLMSRSMYPVLAEGVLCPVVW